MMEHLFTLHSLSFASCMGQWQAARFSQSASISFKLKAPDVLALRLPAIRASVVADELTPKELHHFRKKQAQKQTRKIRKERRAKRRAEELAKIPTVEPKPTLMRFVRPVQNWNKPWKKRKAGEQSPVESHPVTEVDTRKTRAARRKPTVEAAYRKTNSQPLQSQWTVFEAAYQQKVNRFANINGGFEKSHPNFLNIRVDVSAQLSTGYNGPPGRAQNVSKSRESYLGSVGTSTGRYSKGPSRVASVGINRENKASVSLHHLSNDGKERGGSIVQNGNSLARYHELGRSENLSGRRDCPRNALEDLECRRASPFRGDFEDSTKKADSVLEDKDRKPWRRSGGEVPRIHMEAEGKVVTESPEKARTSVAGVEGPKEGDEDLEISEFWDRRDMHLDEKFDRSKMRKKFEDSFKAKKMTKEEISESKRTFGRHIARVIIGRRKGEYVYLARDDSDASHTKSLPREFLDEEKQLEWLANELNKVARPDGVHLSRLIRSGGLKITDRRAVKLVQKLGSLDNWRCAMQVVEWLNSRNHFPAINNRFVFTTLLAVLGRARRPVESLNVFNVMREDVATYPDIAAYRIIAVTLGQSGYMEELFELMRDLRQGPDQKTKGLFLLENHGRLFADVVVYNAALNSCVRHKQWRCALGILDQLEKNKHVRPNSASYGLTIEVLIKAGKFDIAWKMHAKMEEKGFLPNSLTYKVLVEGLGQVRDADTAIKMVNVMEQRGIVPSSAVYYALASTLCMCGRWKDALLEVDRLAEHPKKAIVETYTGFIRACREAELWQDAISIFEHMQKVCAPNIGTYNVMISVYGRSKMYEGAKNLFEKLQKGRISPIKLLSNEPRLSPDTFTYEAMLGACTLSERWEDAEVLLRQMFLQGFRLHSKKHTWIVHSMSQAGKDDLVATIFNHLRSRNDMTSKLYLLMIKSCLRIGVYDEAFSYLEEMVKQDMKIASIDLKEFQEMALLLSEEDRSMFMLKVEGFRVTSEFNFQSVGKLSHFCRQKGVQKPRKTLHELASILDGLVGMPEHGQKDVHTSNTSLAHGSHESSVDSGEDHGTPEMLPLGLGFSSLVPDMQGWELIWEKSANVQQTSNELLFSQQCT